MSARKKTPFQKHREEEEAKKKRAEDETARLYQEFVESFQADNTPGSKAFVRGGTINPNDKLKNDLEGGNSKDEGSGIKKGSRYVPSFIPPPMATKNKEYEKKKEEKPKEREKGKSRNIDHFMEELKQEQELRERRNQDRDTWRDTRLGDNSVPSSRFDELPDEFDPMGKPGSFDDGDPQTTNLYVGNLSPQVDENFLLRTFGRFGPIASVKIMWPRTEEERRRQRNCGFVAFMNRADAQAAKDEMQGVVVYEYELKIGWGKSVSLPSQALPAPPPGHMAIRSKEGATVILSGPSGPPVTTVPSQNSELVLTPNVPDINVVPPDDNHLVHIIDTMALYVLDGGCAFEQAIMERGRGNPLFSFLFELGSKEHTYYVWRLYSFAQGDTLQRWRTEPFIMITGSGRWIPPPLPIVKGPEQEKEAGSTYAAGKSKRLEVERTLTDAQRDEFEDMLRALTLERNQIKEAMGFSLDNADAAGEVVDVLTESLTLKETPIPTKVARLMLVSDILHNSSVPVKNASAYRTRFEATLPDIMESFNDLYRSITGRITAEALKERVLKVLQVWADWFLFSDAYVNGLRATFLRSNNAGVIPFHSICGDAPELDRKAGSSDAGDGGKIDQDAALAIGKGDAMQELLSLPLTELERRCRHNGLSLVGGREMMVAQLLYLEEAEKQRGFEIDDELKYAHSQSNSGRYTRVRKEVSSEMDPRRISARGSHMEDDMQSTGRGSIFLPAAEANLQPAINNSEGKNESILPSSKWAREVDKSDEEHDRSTRDLGLTYSSSGNENAVDGNHKTDEVELAADASNSAHLDGGMNEESEAATATEKPMEASSVPELVRSLYESSEFVATKMVLSAIHYIEHVANEKNGVEIRHSIEELTLVRYMSKGLYFGNIVCVKASLLLQNVSPAKLVSLLKECHTAWLDFDFASHSTAFTKAGCFAYPGLKSHHHYMSDPVVPGYSDYEDESLENIRFKYIGDRQLDIPPPRELHHLQICSRLEDVGFGDCSELIFALIDTKFPNDAKLLSAGFRIYLLGSNAGTNSSANQTSVLLVAFQFPLDEDNLLEDVAAMARDYIRYVMSYVKSISHEALLPAPNPAVANPAMAFNSTSTQTFAFNLAMLMCQGYRSTLGVDTLGFNSRSAVPMLDQMQNRPYAIFCCSFQVQAHPVCIFANKAALIMMESIADKLQNLLMDKVLGGSNNLSRVLEAAFTALEGLNKQAFLTELGNRLHKGLMSHWERFSFNWSRAADALTWKVGLKSIKEWVVALTAPILGVWTEIARATERDDELEPVLAFGDDAKARMATVTVFTIASRYGDFIRTGWRNILDCILRLHKLGLLPARVASDAADDSEMSSDPGHGKPLTNSLSSAHMQTIGTPRRSSGLMGRFSQLLSLDTKEPRSQPTEQQLAAHQRTLQTIQKCHIDSIFTESKFLQADSLLQLARALIRSCGRDFQTLTLRTRFFLKDGVLLRLYHYHAGTLGRFIKEGKRMKAIKGAFQIQIVIIGIYLVSIELGN